MKWSLTALCLSALIAGDLQAQNVLSLGDADLKLLGAASRDQATDVSTAGDVNGDGFDDLVLGSRVANSGGGLNKAGDEPSKIQPGVAYLVYGGPGLPAEIDLADLGDRGVVFVPGSEPGQLGTAVSGAGDFNGDGLHDLVITAEHAGGGGVVYIVFGAPDLPGMIDLSQLGARGVRIVGESGSRLGHAVSNAGDFNRDGFSDIIVGAVLSRTVTHGALGLPPATGSAGEDDDVRKDSGLAIVLLGGPDWPLGADVLDLANRAVYINGADKNDRFGHAVGEAGDFNNDGIDDVIVGAPHAEPFKRHGSSGESYVIFGGVDLPVIIDAGDLGARGLTILGEDGDDQLGFSVAGGFDFNKDFVSDVILGAPLAGLDEEPVDVGRAYVVFGGMGLSGILDLRDSDGAFLEVVGEGASGLFGFDVHGAGDINQDGHGDVLIGAQRKTVDGLYKAGQTLLLYGRAKPPLQLSLNDLTDRDGILFNGEEAGDYSGHCVSDGGDINGDLTPDFAICGNRATPLDRQDAGIFYIFFGRGVPPPTDLACESVDAQRTLTWNSPVVYDSIWVQRNGEQLAELPGDATSFTDTDPILGLLEYKVIGARDGNFSISATCSVSQILLPPVDFRCRSENGDVVLTWAHRFPAPVDGTRIFRDGELIAEVPGDTLSFVDEAPETGEHTYAIRDFIGSIESPEVTCETFVPRPVVELSCSADACDVSLEWLNIDAFTAVKIFRNDEPEPVAILRTGSLESFTDRGVPPGLHEYGVRGCVGENESAIVTCAVEVLAPVENLVGSSLAGDVSLSWDAPAATVDSILVARDGAPVAELPADATGLDDPGLTSGSYEYEVRLRLGDTLGKPATVVVEVVDPVVGLIACSDAASVQLRWELGDDYDAIEVFKDDVMVAELPGSATLFDDTLAAAGDAATYGVVGRRGNGHSSTASTLEETLLPPQISTVILAETTLLLLWSNPSSYDRIELRLNGELVETFPGAQIEAQVEVEPIAEVTVSLRGVRDSGACDDVSDASTESTNVIGRLRDLSCTPDELTVNLSWSRDGTFPTRIERNGEVLAVLDSDFTTFTDELPEAGTFTYRVVGELGLGVDSLPVECTVSIPDRVEDLSCSFEFGTTFLSWNTESEHTAVEITRNGEVLTTLPAGTGAFEDVDPPIGELTYGVRLINGDTRGLLATCVTLALPPPAIVSCAATGGDVEIVWTYDGPEGVVFGLERDETGVPGDIPGDARSFLDEDVLPGEHCYRLVAAVEGGRSAFSEPCCTEVVVPVVQLVCSAEDAEVTLTWSLPREYDSIEVSRNGELVDTLAGSATLFVDPSSPLDPGAYTYDVRGVVGDSISEPTSCTLQIPEEVLDLSCVQQGDAISLTWTLPGVVPGITIHRNGQRIATLPSDATSFLDEGLTPSIYSYEVRTGSGDVFGLPVECSVDMIEPPQEVTCEVDEMTLTVSWTPVNDYDSVDLVLLMDSSVVDERTIPGDQTSVTLEDLGAGQYTVELRGLLDGNTSTAASCNATVISPILGLSCMGSGTDAALTWENGELYDEIVIERTRQEDADVATFMLEGDRESFVDSELENATYAYVVIGKVGDVETRSDPCTVVIEEPRFLRGDSNLDARLNIADAIYNLNWSFRNGPVPPCRDAADADDNGVIDLMDSMHILQWQFRGGEPPASPFPGCGVDPTDDDPLDCETYPEELCQRR